MRTTALLALLALACGGSAAPPDKPDAPDKPATPAAPPPKAGSDLAGDCPPTASTSVGETLGAAHPCRAWVEALWGRVVSVGIGTSGTIWYTTPRKNGVVVTCQHCFSGSAGLRAPGGPEPVAAIVGAGPVLDGGAVKGQVYADNATDQRTAYLVYAPAYPASAADRRGQLTNIAPVHDWVVTAMSGAVIRVPGQLGFMPPEVVPADPLSVRDPSGLLGVEVTGDPVAGEMALTLGYPNVAAGAMMFTANRIHGDDAAADIISRAEPGERAIPYDPAIEFLMAGQLTAGNSGGGVFDRRGRYLGVMVRGSVTPVDGVHFVRVVRARYIEAELARMIAAAAPELRDAVAPFVAR